MAAGKTAWLLLVALRLVWVVIPQFGYIHPDEFFQGPEIVAGDILDLDVHRSWEFNTTSPIRSIVFPYLISGPPFYLLKYLIAAGFDARGLILNTMTLLVLPRLMLVLMGFVMDFFIVRMSKMTGSDRWSNLLLFGSSYVAIVYMSHTFSNTVEVLLFTALLYFVMVDSEQNKENQPASKKEQISVKGDKEKTLDLTKGNGHYFNATAISSIIVMGIFNRPSFVAFAIVPYLYWLKVRCSTYDFDSLWKVAGKIFSCIPGAVLTLAVFTLIDSMYYGSPAKILECLHGFVELILKGGCCLTAWRGKMAEFSSQLTLTPLNFFKYNSDSKNLAEHGIHPPYTHAAVNLQILFGILPILFLLDIIRWVSTRRPSSRIKAPYCALLYMCFLIPLALLSLVPHQEPRFLLPLIAPITLICGGKIFGQDSYKVLKVTWVIFNILAAMLFGGLHQAGLVQCISYLQKYLYSTRQDSATQHIIFYHTYMPPRHLLAIPNHHDNGEGHRKSKVFVHDLAGASEEVLHSKILDIMGSMKKKCGEIYVVSPATLYFHCKKIQSGKYEYKLLEWFSPHLSMEDPPDLERDVLCEALSDRDCREKCFKDVSREWEKIKHAFALNLYEIELKYV
ncbi:GPI mannosyltransferase 4 [Lingula anatina]|uniref:Mannosyltransferase n=1 Tax=Lingula anatina TaxID=7574 RepID=A0A1S3ISU0_LINAN|nr:GPI mannosyltransferase 4 [Lingula anatina]|eukprot:XP_013401272.1 GPI mannosyltransferase 4 [Lingula anatina]